MHIAASASQSDTSRRQTLKEIIMAELTHLNSASLVLTNLSKLLPILNRFIRTFTPIPNCRCKRRERRASPPTG